MAKLSELINQYTVTMDAVLSALDANDLKFYPAGMQKWLVTITTNSGKAITIPLYYPKTHVVKPSNNKYHPRYGADISVDAPGGIGTIMDDEWWYAHGQPIKPRIDELASKCADLAFFMRDVESYEEYCQLKGVNEELLKNFLLYQSDQAAYAALVDFLGDQFDLFVNAEVDI
jgi:hypothetical protein